MMSILIRGMEMPKERSLWFCIKTDGTVYNIKPGGVGTAHAVGTAVPLPEGHGEENERLKKQIVKLERKIMQMEEETESNAAWERDFRNGQVQGMW